MPRQPVWPPRVTLHRATGQARVRINGKDFYLGKHGSEEAKAEYARLVADLAAGKAPAPKKAARAAAIGSTVADAVAAWWEMAEAKYTDRGREVGMFRLSLRPLLRLYGPTPARDFGCDQLEALQMAMATGSWMNEEELAQAKKKAGDPNRAGWCRNVVNRRITRVKTVWRWAERKQLVPPGAWANLRAVPGLAENARGARKTAPVKPATWLELVKVCRQCLAAVRAMLLLQWFSGMRSGEVRTLRPCDLDTSGPIWLYRPAEHKNDWRGHERVIVLGPRCQGVLRSWLARAKSPEAHLFKPARARTALCYTTFTYAQAVRRAAKRAGVDGFHAYQCRHSAKDRACRELGLDAARALLGQKSVEVTARYAAGVDQKTAADVAKKLG